MTLKELKNKYPEKLKTVWPEHESGWFDIIDGILKRIELLEKKLNFKVEILQIKEKFGTLRFYYSILTHLKDETIYDIINDIVLAAEQKSAYVCEKCGEYGRIRTSGHWLKTLCDKHKKEHGYKDKIRS